MILTRVHAEYWRSKQPVPEWVKKLDDARKKSYDYSGGVSANDCVNAHAPAPAGRVELDTGNFVSLLKLHRRNIRRGAGTTLLDFLDSLASHPNSTDSPKRTALAHKWAKKIRRAKLIETVEDQ